MAPERCHPPRSRWPSPVDLLVLHAVRVGGMATEASIAERYDLGEHLVGEQLLDDQAVGWVTRVEFADICAWTLTERGRAEDTRRVGEEVDRSGARSVLERSHHEFERLNERLVRACTDWQLRSRVGEPFAVNDHTDARWDTRVLADLSALEPDLVELVIDLTSPLVRFGGYDARFSIALARAQDGQGEWVTGVGRASCHSVWMELHEDLLSTLGRTRGAAADDGRREP